MSNYRSVTFTQARQLISDWSAEHITSTEIIALGDTSARIAADNLSAERGIPDFDCCAVDGYAVAFSSLVRSEGGALQLIPNNTHNKSLKEGCAEHAANQPKKSEHSCNLAVQSKSVDQVNNCRVYQGQKLPDFADTVIAFNQVVGDKNNGLTLTVELQKGDNIYARHSDLRVGQKIIKQGESVTAQQLALLTALTYSKLRVRKRPTVVLLIINADKESKTASQTVDDKLEMLKALLTNMGCRVILAKQINNRPKFLQEILLKLLEKNIDFLILTGSPETVQNEKLLNLLNEKGQIAFQQVRAKPDSCTAFGRFGQSLFFALPSDPVAVFCGVCQFVWPAIKKVLGQNGDDLLWRGKITHDLKKRHFHREFIRAFFIQTIEGHLEVTACGARQSSRIKSLTEANCFMILDESDQSVRAGEVVRIQPFYQFATRTV